jgi:hypothetical protein
MEKETEEVYINMEKIFCETCGMEFRDKMELDAHKGLAHDSDPMGHDRDSMDVEDPGDDIPFEKAVPKRE